LSTSSGPAWDAQQMIKYQSSQSNFHYCTTLCFHGAEVKDTSSPWCNRHHMWLSWNSIIHKKWHQALRDSFFYISPGAAEVLTGRCSALREGAIRSGNRNNRRLALMALQSLTAIWVLSYLDLTDSCPREENSLSYIPDPVIQRAILVYNKSHSRHVRGQS
jgi:hypothetical protein